MSTDPRVTPARWRVVYDNEPAAASDDSAALYPRPFRGPFTRCDGCDGRGHTYLMPRCDVCGGRGLVVSRDEHGRFVAGER